MLNKGIFNHIKAENEFFVLLTTTNQSTFVI